MRRSLHRFATTALVSGGFALACGGRSELPPGAVTSAGTAGVAGSSAVACVDDADCPAPPPEQCGVATCVDGACVPVRGEICDDGDPCTTDSCQSGRCVFTDARIDGDGDGAFATGNQADPRARLGCGTDCDDGAPDTFPGAPELCDSRDNDCDGLVDEGTQLVASNASPVRVSPASTERAGGGGLAFDGEAFGATMTIAVQTRTESRFQQLSARGALLGEPLRIARVNARSYGGPLAWTGERYVTAYQDARQDGNYEIYFDVLNRKGERLIDDLRVTSAADYSLNPSLLWTGTESLLVWDDRRFEASGDAAALFGQRVSSDGKLVGANVRLSAPGLRAENASAALGADSVGIAFVALDAANVPRLKFMTTSRTLSQPSAPTDIGFDDPNDPVVTALNDGFVVTFHQDSGVIGPAIYGVLLGKDGATRGFAQSMTAGAAHARTHATFSYGDHFLLVWADDRSGTYQLSAQFFDAKLAPMSSRIPVTTTMSNAFEPTLAAASDGGIGVLFNEESGGRQAVFFTRLDCRARPGVK